MATHRSNRQSSCYYMPRMSREELDTSYIEMVSSVQKENGLKMKWQNSDSGIIPYHTHSNSIMSACQPQAHA